MLHWPGSADRGIFRINWDDRRDPGTDAPPPLKLSTHPRNVSIDVRRVLSSLPLVLRPTVLRQARVSGRMAHGLMCIVSDKARPVAAYARNRRRGLPPALPNVISAPSVMSPRKFPQHRAFLLDNAMGLGVHIAMSGSPVARVPLPQSLVLDLGHRLAHFVRLLGRRHHASCKQTLWDLGAASIKDDVSVSPAPCCNIHRDTET